MGQSNLDFHSFHCTREGNHQIYIKMKITLFVTLAILLVLVVLAESSPARRRGRISRGRQAARNARGRFNNRRQLARRGRTGTAAADADAAAADAGAEGEEAEFDGPAWCNPEDPMGAWLLYKGVKLNCVDNGIEEFGRYGGIPAEDEDVPE